ncbi:MAG: DUF4192 domain-containing protein, partial [Gordonia sp.]
MAQYDSPSEDFPDGTVLPQPVHAGTLITAIPALLGFVPESSLIVLAYRGDNTIIATMRYDLLLRADGRPRAELRSTIAGIGNLCREYGAEAIVAVIVDDRHRIQGPQYRTVLSLCERAFVGSGGMSAGLITAQVAEGQRWWAGHTGQSAGTPSPVRIPDSREGLIGDPRTSPTAVREAVTTGRRVLDCRDEMTTMLDPVTCDCHTCTRPRAIGDTDSGSLLRRVLVRLGDGQRCATDIGCTEAAMLATALTDLTVRDTLLALAVTDMRGDAETLWRALARRLTGSARASAASLLAHLHYIAGEGAYAAVALDTALDADPEWSL